MTPTTAGVAASQVKAMSTVAWKIATTNKLPRELLNNHVSSTLARPAKDSFNGQLADAYCEDARARGHEVRINRLGEMRFDPMLWNGLKVIQLL